MKGLPQEFVTRMRSVLGDNYTCFEASLNEPPVKGYRVNTEKIALEDFEPLNIFGAERIPYVENGFYLEYEKIGNHPYHHAGMIYVQEPAAMASAECVEIEKDWKILDMCAAPGGKSSQLANKLSENGVLVSNEIIPARCRILTGNIERLGIKNAVVTCMDTDRLASLFPETFDLVVADAPCSGEGMFRKEDIAIDEWSEENVIKCAERQSMILDNAAVTLKCGGYIIYSTCTYSLEENEMTVDAFLRRHPEFELCPVTERVRANSVDGIRFDGAFCDSLELTRRFYPHINRGEGQFVALLRKKGEAAPERRFAKNAVKLDKTLTDFLDDTLCRYDKNAIRLYRGTPVYFSPDFAVADGVAFAFGVTLGEIRKNYFQPHHQLFMALGNDFKRKIELKATDERVNRYLRGEEIETDLENGWAAVTVDGCTLGGAKVVSGRAKNHYPKGLRMF